jgi:hypothetical protein
MLASALEKGCLNYWIVTCDDDPAKKLFPNFLLVIELKRFFFSFFLKILLHRIELR